MPGTKSIVIAIAGLFGIVTPARANVYFDIGLHGRVLASDTIVLARVVDPMRARLNVERVLKGDPPQQIAITSYVDGFAAPADRKPLAVDTRELLFLRKQDDGYAPVQDQYGRMLVAGDRLVDSFLREPRSLSQTLASIERLVALQSRAARSETEADAAHVAALESEDVEVQMWALWKAKDDVKTPSRELIDALLARWPKDVGPVYGTWNAAGLIANAVVVWRVERAAPMFVRILSTSANGAERAWAAMALGGTGDRSSLTLLRRVAAEDPERDARSLAYEGIRYILGPDSLSDLQRGAKDTDERVRAQAVVAAYNMLEFGQPHPRWPPPSNELIAEVRALLLEMQHDPARLVSDNARSMLTMIVRNRR